MYNSIRTITVARMTVPCCGGLSYAVKAAIENSGKDIPPAHRNHMLWKSCRVSLHHMVAFLQFLAKWVQRFPGTGACIGSDKKTGESLCFVPD